ncbi:hypothetical protein JQM83_12775, partial [Parabacteroides distasonis]|nr:hypothetical protein [Parabacteroides distasonis]
RSASFSSFGSSSGKWLSMSQTGRSATFQKDPVVVVEPTDVVLPGIVDPFDLKEEPASVAGLVGQ